MACQCTVALTGRSCKVLFGDFRFSKGPYSMWYVFTGTFYFKTFAVADKQTALWLRWGNKFLKSPKTPISTIIQKLGNIKLKRSKLFDLLFGITYTSRDGNDLSSYFKKWRSTCLQSEINSFQFSRIKSFFDVGKEWQLKKITRFVSFCFLNDEFYVFNLIGRKRKF